ncbi:MAG: hypothetical protein ACKVRP_04070 [Bacteroidota bacterium]
MRRLSYLCFSLLIAFHFSFSQSKENSNPPIYIAFLWHMHQPIYWPYETVVQTDQNNRYSYSVADIHNQRWGPYTSWPKNAVQAGINAILPNFGAQVSFSGSLIENLNTLESAGNGNFQNWKSHWSYIKQQNTTLGNPRLDMVAFGYHHPLMGLIEYLDIRKQIQAHRQIMAVNFPGAYSKGIFPPENAFSPRSIPALVDEGIEWVMVDNVHFDRAATGYSFSTSGNLYEANKADVRNPNPGDWVQLNGLWAPTQNSARWGRQPHWVEYIDPATGTSKKIIAIPTDRYLGNEDGRSGFGALNYEYVMSQLESYNTDPNQPVLIVLHHDGDNYGGGSDGYYNSNFQNFVNWLVANPTRFKCTTVQDYLEMFPPNVNDVIHIEDGSWSGADNGDPEFKKWNGDPSGGYSPDRNSWGIITAAKNFVATAEQINPGSANTVNAWKYFMNGEASDYWYWDGSQNGIWDSHPARASNLAIPYAQTVIGSGTDLTPPTIYVPQREPYNPGATEWGINQPADFTVWTYTFDVSGLQSVTLKYRTDLDGNNSNATTHNETYSGGSDVTAWTNITMAGVSIPSQTNPQPLYKAKEYSARVTGLTNALVDYYIEAMDSNGNIARSPIMHVWVGPNPGGGGGGTPGVSWTPTAPTQNDTITITVSSTQGGKLHWGVNNTGSTWQTPNNVYWPSGTALFGGSGPAVETPFVGPDSGALKIKIGPFNNSVQAVNSVAFVIHYNDNSWNNNSGQDFHIEVSGNPPPPQGYVMDGSLDTAATLVVSNSGLTLHLDWNGIQLYAATQSAQSQGGDMFIVIADSQRALRSAMWAKGGSVAGWNAFIGNESSNNWNGWFNAAGTQFTGSGVSAAGTALEGALNIESTLGHIPQAVYVAVGKYQSPDAGSLLVQTPAGNGNGTIEFSEFYTFPLDSVPPLQPPAQTQLVTPANEAQTSDSIVFRWHTAHFVVSKYWFELAVDSLFAVSIVDSSVTDTTTIRTSLTTNQSYWWRVRAWNSAGWGPFSLTRSFTALDGIVSLHVSFSTGWSMLSNPVTTNDDSVQELYPTSLLPYAFSFNPASGYVQNERMMTGSGYWTKFGTNGTSSITGLAQEVDTIAVETGWNMIGSISFPVATSSVTSMPPGIQASSFYEYDGTSYSVATAIQPGKAYWVKASTTGVFVLTSKVSSTPAGSTEQNVR